MISRRRLLSTTATALGTSLIAGAVPAAAHPTQPTAPAGTGAEALRVGRPTAEYVRQPLGLGPERPRLSWPLAATGAGRTQSAYQVRVALSERALEKPDVWDSGKVVSGQSVHVTYGGPRSAPVPATTGPYGSGTARARSPPGPPPPGGRPASPTPPTGPPAGSAPRPPSSAHPHSTTPPGSGSPRATRRAAPPPRPAGSVPPSRCPRG